MNALIDEIYRSGEVRLPSGGTRKLSAAVSRDEGAAIHRIIAGDASIRSTLEIGCANGLSSLHICDALGGRDGTMHTIVDPFQMSDWGGAGIENLRLAGFANFRLIEQGSEIALPDLLRSCARFQFVFIDGWHSFDQTLMDCMYGLKLLDVGGYLAVDDADMPSIDKAIACLSRYPCLVRREAVFAFPDHPLLNVVCRLGSFVPTSANWRYRLPKAFRKIFRKPRMVVFQKTAEDRREWNWFKPF